MANITITQLPSAGALTGSELVPIVQNGVTVQTTTGAISGAGALNYPFLTVGSTAGLTQARYLSATTGISLTDNGAGNTLTINMTGSAASLNAASTGIIVKNSSSTVTNRSLAVGTGMTIADADGIAGNPTFGLSTLLQNIATTSAPGLLTVNGTTVTASTIIGTTDQISVANGNGVGGSPTVGIASNPVLPGSAYVGLPSGTTAQRGSPAYGAIRYNTDIQTLEAYTQASGWGAIVSGAGVTTFSAGTTGFTPSSPTTGAIVLDGVLNVSNGGTGTTTLTGYVIGNGTSAFSASATIPTTDLSGTVSNAQLANSAITINGSSVSLGGSITVTATASNALTIGTGLSGTSYNGSAPVTIAIDSTVATLTGVQTLTNKSMSGASNTFSSIPNSALSNSTISGVALGSNLYALTIGTGLSGGSYDGSGIVTVAIDSTVATLTGVQTLTNKSISGSTNTLTNIPNSALTNSSVTIGSTSVSLGGTTTTLAGLTSITLTQDPVSDLQVATKQYVDSIASGLNYHQPVNYASVAALPAYTYNNGSSGVGATITANANGALSFGGGSPTATQRLLVKDEVGGNAAYNGIYVVTDAGSPTLPFILTRATDYDTSGTGTNEIDAGDYVLVLSGTNASTAWVQQTPLPIVVGTTALVFLQFNAPITYTAGTGLNLSPSTTFNISNTGVTAATYGSASSVPTIAVNAQGQITSASNTSIAINGNQITSGTVGSAYITGSYTGITGVGTLTAGTWNATKVDPAYGGTGISSYTIGDLLYASGTTTISKLAIGASSYVLTSTGSAPQYVAQSTLSVGSATTATTATTATNVAGGAAGSLVYQSGAGATTTLALGTTNYVLTAGASAPQYVAQSTLSVGSATTATNATNTAITANSTNADYYITVVSANTGNLPQLVATGLTANPSTGKITSGVSGGTF